MVFRILELYSGIGGMHYAVKESGVSAEVIAAVDVNDLANDVYKFNFPTSNLMQRSIEGITLKQFDKLKVDVILMSPPCQPFTRVGLQADSADPRTKSFFHVLDLIQRTASPPSFILLENVKGFENSDTRNHLITTLKNCKYQFQEFLLSPNQFGIPNSRLRYFLIAKREPYQFHFKRTDQILEKLPEKCFSSCSSETGGSSVTEHESTVITNEGQVETTVSAPSIVEHTNEITKFPHATSSGSHLTAADSGGTTVPMDSTTNDEQKEICENSQTCTNKAGEAQDSEYSCELKSKCIGEFLECEETDFSQYFVSETTLLRFGRLMDIVKPTSCRSCCFTKAYYHYVEGTGSVIQTNTTLNTAETFSKILKLPDEDPNKLHLLKSLQLRYFTPREVASLMAFRQEFNFPESTTLKQRYRLLGNSLNVHVVARLLKDYLLDS